MNDFGTTLKNLRRERRVTQRELADKVGVDFTYISKMENGRLENSPSEKTIAEIARVLDADANELILLAKKVPSAIRETITTDDLAVAFLRKVPAMSPEQKKIIQEVLDEV
jgi:transcriptional regulator with XRE-family HTH domain